MIASKRHFFTSLAIAASMFALDQLSKYWLLYGVGFYDRQGMVIELTGFFNLVMVWNYGISFGMFSGAKLPYALIVLAAAIILLLLNWLRKTHDRLVVVGVGCVIGGAVGNVIDRIRYGAVADFFDFHAFGYHWPSFNIADSAIFIGVVVLCIQAMMQPVQK